MNRSRVRRRSKLGRALFLMALALAVLLGVATEAGAATRYSHAGAFGSIAELPQPQRMAVHQASGTLYIVDRAGNRVRVYRRHAEDLLEHVTDITAADRDAGNLNQPSTIAVDQQSGAVYVAKTSTPPTGGELIRFLPDDIDQPSSFGEDVAFTSPTGVSWGQVGGSVASGEFVNLRGGLAIGRLSDSSPVIFVANPTNNRVYAFDETGAAAAVFPSPLPGVVPPQSNFTCGSCAGGGAFATLADIATASDGSLYAVDVKDSQIRLVRLAATADIYDFDTNWATGLATASPRVAVDQVAGEIFVANNTRYAQIESPESPEIRFLSDPVPPPGPVPNQPDIVASLIYTSGIAVLGDHGAEQSGSLYYSNIRVVVRNTLASEVFQTAIQVYDDTGELAEPPEPTMHEVDLDQVAGTTAALSGTLVPNEVEAKWRFEYRKCVDGTCDAWPPSPPAGPALDGPLKIEQDEVGSPQQVTMMATDLEPNTTYEARLMAVNSAVVTGVASEPVSFTTAKAAPFVSPREVESISAWRATLVGHLDPRNSDVQYHFELRRGAEEPVQVPATPDTLAASEGPGPATAEATELEPGAEYEARLIAAVAGAPELSTIGEWVQFSTLPAAESSIPERSFELVSPLFTNAVGARSYALSPDGNRAVINTGTPLPDSENAYRDHRVVNRSDDGSWEISDYRAGPPLDPGTWGMGSGSAPVLSRDLGFAAWSQVESYDEHDTNANNDVYIRDTQSGEVTWVSRPADTGQPWPISPSVNYVSEGGSQVIFRRGAELYEWKNGVLRRIAFRPGEPTGTIPGSILGSGTSGGTVQNAIADGGRRIIFSLTVSGNNLNPTDLYINDNGEVVEVATGNPIFWGASADGAAIFYEKSGNLYEYNLDSGQTEMVHPEVNGGAGVRNALHVSDDGNRVYFTSTKDILGGGHNVNPYGLWLAERPNRDSAFSITYIGALNQISAPGVHEFNKSYLGRPFLGNADGSIFVFVSRGDLVPGRDAGGNNAVYVYLAASGKLYCASCPSDGSPQLGHATPQNWDGGGSGIANRRTTGGYALDSYHAPRVIADDGTVIFGSKDRLADGDANSALDVYEWRGGEVALVSSGVGDLPDVVSEISRDGKTILFDSRVNLVPGITETVRRAYVARVGGGYTGAAPLEPVCTGVGCREQLIEPILPRRDAAAQRRTQPAADGRRCNAEARALRQKRKRLRRAQVSLRKSRSVAARRRAVKLRRQVRRSRVATKQARQVLAQCRRGA